MRNLVVILILGLFVIVCFGCRETVNPETAGQAVHADYILSGEVVRMDVQYDTSGVAIDTLYPGIEAIAVTFNDSLTTTTNSYGVWSIETRFADPFSVSENPADCNIHFADVDGAENGRFYDHTVNLLLDRNTPGYGGWFLGIFSCSLWIEMTRDSSSVIQ